MVLLAVLAPLLAFDTTNVLSQLKISDCDFGEVRPFSVQQCNLRIENLRRLKVRLRIEPIDSADSVVPQEVTLDSGASADIVAHVNLGDAAGEVVRSFKVIEEGPAPPRERASAKGFVATIFDQPHPKADFGSIESVAAAQELSVEVASHDVAGASILSILDKPDFVDVSVEPDGRSLRVRLKGDAPSGSLEGTIKLAMSTPQQPEYWVQVTATINGPISPKTNPFWFGIVPWSPDRVLHIALLNSAKENFEIGKVTAIGNIKGSASLAECEPKVAGCKEILFHVAEDQTPGLIRAHLLVDLAEHRQRLSVAIWGFLKGKPDAAVAGPTKSEPEVPTDGKAGSASGVQAPSASALGTPLVHSLPVDASALPVLAGRGPLLRWAVSSDVAVHGYQIFRAASNDGPFLLLNQQTIPSQHVANGQAQYQWRDTSATAGMTYWYYIGIVFNDGRKQQLSGAQKTTAK